jgi:transmembrane sensor
MSKTPFPGSAGSVEDWAAYWAVRLEEESVTELECREFGAWVLSDPAHEKAYLDQIAIGALASGMTLRSRTSGLHVVGGQSGPAAPRTMRRWRYVAAAAAVLLAVVAAAWLFMTRGISTPPYVTGTGELRTVTFDDGSTATLNTKSEMRWVGTSRERQIILKRGEALFSIVPDPSRPFLVLIDQIEIRVIGTQFDAYRKADGTVVVSVLDGTIDVRHIDTEGAATWSRRLGANQQIAYRAPDAPAVHDIIASKAVKWTHGEMEVDEAPLSEVVAELARYTDQRIVANDPRLNRMHVGGVLSVRDVHGALEVLTQHAPIDVIWNSQKSEYTLRYRDAAAPEPRSNPVRPR